MNNLCFNQKFVCLVLFFGILILSCQQNSIYAQRIPIQGIVLDRIAGSPVEGVLISSNGKGIGVTDQNGKFEIKIEKGNEEKLVFSSLEYKTFEYSINGSEILITIYLELSESELETIEVFAASRLTESIQKAPLSIEKLSLKAIKESPALTFYDALQSIKGVQMVTSSLFYKQINTRGFNNTGNIRFLQLIDGVDNQPPGLNFSVGNLFGPSELDIESVELIPGAASALYGPIAFNGLLSMQTKDPFDYQGLSIMLKGGVNHWNTRSTNPAILSDFALRFSKAWKDKLAFKVNFQRAKGLDWYAEDYRDVSFQTDPLLRGPSNPGKDELNTYGDEVTRNLPGIGWVSRTGYFEKELMDYNSGKIQVNAAIHYKLPKNRVLIYQFNFGQGSAVFTGSSRFSLKDYIVHNQKLELKGDNFFLRAYSVGEDSKSTYNSRSLAQQINRTWVRDLSGNLVPRNQADQVWFQRYQAAYSGAINNLTPGNHGVARAFADQGRLIPGTESFNQAKDLITSKLGLEGAGVFTQSKIYHAEGQYDLSGKIGWMNLLIGGNYRMYDMFTKGSLFDDLEKKVRVQEVGVFVQANKKILSEKLNLTSSIRYDRNFNFKGQITPRFGANYELKENQYLRFSYQSGFRSPTPVDQFIKLNVGPIIILGGAPSNSVGLNAYENSFTSNSVTAFSQAYNKAIQNGQNSQQALLATKSLLVKSNVDYIQPEKNNTLELGYRATISKKIFFDISSYLSSYRNFQVNTLVVRPDSPSSINGEVNLRAAEDILNGRVQRFQLYTNSKDRVSVVGISGGLQAILGKNFSLLANLTYSEINLGSSNPNNIAPFNTPKFSGNLGFGNFDLGKGFGFYSQLYWQSSFDWYGTFNGNRPGNVPAYSLLDIQFNKELKKINAFSKLGVNNLLNNRISQAFGSPQIGGIGYLSLIFNLNP